MNDTGRETAQVPLSFLRLRRSSIILKIMMMRKAAHPFHPSYAACDGTKLQLRHTWTGTSVDVRGVADDQGAGASHRFEVLYVEVASWCG